MNWHQYFTMLEDCKQFPAYRAEPRIDSFIGYYLKDFINDFISEDIQGIIPEFPLKISDHNALSCKVDFYLIGASGTHYLVEFKTDSHSISKKQIEYLFAAKAQKMDKIIEGIIHISKASSYKKKYKHLLSNLVKLKIINDKHDFIAKSNEVKIIYIQPHTTTQSLDNILYIDFNWIAGWLRNHYKNDEFALRFATTLQRWAVD